MKVAIEVNFPNGGHGKRVVEIEDLRTKEARMNAIDRLLNEELVARGHETPIANWHVVSWDVEG